VRGRRSGEEGGTARRNGQEEKSSEKRDGCWSSTVLADCGKRKLERGNWKEETGKRKLERGNWKEETGKRKLEMGWSFFAWKVNIDL
jgi:hypothetical protein